MVSALPLPVPQSTPTPLLTAEQVAALLQVPKKTVYDWAAAGRLPGVVRLGRLLRFNEAAVAAWLAAGGTAGVR